MTGGDILDSGVLVTMTEADARTQFRDWLRLQFQTRGFYTPSSGKYALTDFSRKFEELTGERVTTFTLARWLQDENVLPSADNCRNLAQMFGMKPAEVLGLAGYIRESDF